MTPQDILVIGADTIVACDDTILGKPKDEAGAKADAEAFVGKKNMPCIQALRLCFWTKMDERAHIPFTRKQKLP